MFGCSTELLDSRLRGNDGVDSRLRGNEGVDSRLRGNDGVDSRLRGNDGVDSRLRRNDGVDARLRGNDGGGFPRGVTVARYLSVFGSGMWLKAMARPPRSRALCALAKYTACLPKRELRESSVA